MFKKVSNDWQGINDDINYLQHKNNRFRWNKLLAFLAALLLAVAVAGTGGYYFIESMVQALNYDNFKTPDVDLEGADFRVNMDLVKITVSDENLRLNYFEDTLKVKIFAHLNQMSWWKVFLSRNPDDFDVAWYKSNTNDKLQAIDVSKDGIDPCDLVLTVKNSVFPIRIHIGSFIYNTGKFYEKFMIFNRFETMYNEVDNNHNPIVNHIANKGYLSQAYSVAGPAVLSPLLPYNKAVYEWIEKRIRIFSNNESQELVSNSGDPVMYPILTSLANLPDIDLSNTNTLVPYMPLFSESAKNYYSNDDVLIKYKSLNARNRDFTIIYSPVPDLVERIHKAKITDVNQLDNFLLNNKLNFVPFVQNNESKVAGATTTIRFATPHKLIFQGSPVTTELTNYIYYASNTMNINDFKIAISSNWVVSGVDNSLKRDVLWWILNSFSNDANEVSLNYPQHPPSPFQNTPEDRFKYLIKNYLIFQKYFSSDTNLTGDTFDPRITYYDKDNKPLTLNPLARIPYRLIKHVEIAIGPDVITPGKKVNYGAQSFSFFMKTIWI